MTKCLFAYFLLLTVVARAATGVEVHVTESAVLHSFEKNTDTKLDPSVANVVTLDSPALLTSANRVPVILIPVYSSRSSVTVTSPMIADVLEKQKQIQVGQVLAAVMPEIADIQSLIRNRQTERALQQLESLQNRYPDIRFFDFIRASILFLQGHKNEAQKLTEEALKVYPDYREGQQFLNRIKAGQT